MSQSSREGHVEDLDSSVVTTFTLATSSDDDGPEEWLLKVVDVPFDSQPDAGRVLAEATVYRAHFDRSWFERLDSVDQDLAGVAEDFLDRDLVETVDEESAFANAIAVVYSVEIYGESRGRELRGELVRSLSRVFGNDIIAMRPDDVSATGDEFTRRSALKQWRELGFVELPGRSSAMLPLSARLAELED